MYTFYGVWVDHAHAFIVKSNKIAEMTIKEITSSVEPRRRGGLMGDEKLVMTDQRANTEHRKHEMHDFAKTIFKEVEDATEWVIFGPGQAKKELENEVEKNKALAEKLKGVETTDKMSEAQLKAYVKEYFHLPRD